MIKKEHYRTVALAQPDAKIDVFVDIGLQQFHIFEDTWSEGSCRELPKIMQSHLRQRKGRSKRVLCNK